MPSYCKNWSQPELPNTYQPSSRQVGRSSLDKVDTSTVIIGGAIRKRRGALVDILP